MPPLDGKNVKLLALVLIASIMVAGAIGAVSLLKKTGVSIKINVESEINALLSTEEGKYKTYVQVLANDPIVGNTSIEVYRGFVDSHQLFLDASNNKRFRNVLDHWIQRLGNGKLFRDFKTYLLVSIWFISSGDSYRVVPDKGVNYNPFKAKSSLIETSITVKAKELKNINGTAMVEVLKSGKAGLKPKGRYFTTYRWMINYEHSVIPNDYVKTPVMLLENPSSEARIVGVVSLRHTYTSCFRVTLAYGYRILNVPTPSLDIWSTDIFAFSDKMEFWRSQIVEPAHRSGWIYILAKPVILFEEEYKELWYYEETTGVYYLVSTTPTGYQRITAKISDVDLYIEDNVKKIVGGAEYGFPANDFTDWFFSKTTLEQPDITHKVLTSDGGEGSTVYLKEILKSYTNGDDVKLGVGVPAGALLASAVPELAPVVSGLSVSLSYTDSDNTLIGGFVQNYGPGNVTFKVAVSVYEYDFGSGYYNLPSGIYFKFEPTP
ncbi:MAG: hypothetical protein ACP6IP_03250 [Candidatus Njordarchaeia archaeon]